MNGGLITYLYYTRPFILRHLFQDKYSDILINLSFLQEAPAPDWAARVARVRAVCSSASSSGLLPPPPQLTKSGDSSPLKNHFTKIHRKQILSPVVRVKELGFDWCLVPKVAFSIILS